MADRRRSRSGPLTRIADRSPLHAFGVWLVKSALTIALLLVLWLFIVNWAVPALVDGFRP